MIPAAFLTDKDEIKLWLDACFWIPDGYTIADDGQVTVTGNATVTPLAQTSMSYLAVQFAEVSGSFLCSGCEELTSLRGSPMSVGGDFSCRMCPKLTTLVGAPKHVGKIFSCSACTQLTNFEGGPLTVVGGYYAADCSELQSLSGAPAQISAVFSIRDCPKVLDYTFLPNIHGRFVVSQIPEDPALVASFIRNKTLLDLYARSPIISIVNDYHKSGDLLTAISQFEDYFKMPFPGTITPGPTISELNTLC